MIHVLLLLEGNFLENTAVDMLDINRLLIRWDTLRVTADSISELIAYLTELK